MEMNQPLATPPVCPPEHEGTRVLLLAVLEEAISCAKGQVVGLPGVKKMQYSRQQTVRTAQQWFDSNDHRSPFSFLSICDVLNLDAIHIRKNLLHLAPPTYRTARRYNR
jgi:hypothetical protein